MEANRVALCQKQLLLRALTRDWRNMEGLARRYVYTAISIFSCLITGACAAWQK